MLKRLPIPSDIDYRIQSGRWMIKHDDIIEHFWFYDEAHF